MACVEFHKAYSHVTGQDTCGKTVRSGRVRNDRRSVANFFGQRPFRSGSHSQTDGDVRLAGRDLRRVLAHPLKVKAIAEAKIKTGKIDATILSHGPTSSPQRMRQSSGPGTTAGAAGADVLRATAHDGEGPHLGLSAWRSCGPGGTGCKKIRASQRGRIPLASFHWSTP